MSFGAARDGLLAHGLTVPMRDGVRLATTVYLPEGEGPFPVVLVRTAYNRQGVQNSFFLRHGIAFVVQDCRGRYESEGDYVPFVHEPDDGYDTLEWLGRQPWCNGRVGMYGDSYLAATQYAAATAGSPNLVALNPRFMADDHWRHCYYCSGALSLGLTWSWLCFECGGRVSHAAHLPSFAVLDLLATPPLATLDERSGAGRIASWRHYVERASHDAQWAQVSLKDTYARFTMPVLLTAGWYDNYAGEMLRTFVGLCEHASSPDLRQSHRLIIGPWTHGVNGRTTLGEVDFGGAALAENDATHRWLQTLLHGGTAADFQAAPIRVFTMGINRWQDLQQWPPANAHLTSFYLHQNSHLDETAPTSDEQPDEYRYDPANPVPTLGGNHSIGSYNPGLYEHAMPGPLDQRTIEERPDVLTYTSAPLTHDLEVTGPVLLRLFIASSAKDTDFVGRLCEVFADGRSINITEGILRARFREDLHAPPKLLTPGEVVELTIDLQATSNVFRAGHRLRLQVTSSCFPLWAPNRNTGNDPAWDTETVIARQTIFHDARHPSHLILPVIRQGV